MPPAKSRRQVRLSFTPLETSSPAPEDAGEGSSRTYARVGYEGARKRRRIASGDDDLEEVPLPTPRKSSQFESAKKIQARDYDLDESSEPLPPSSTIRKRKSQQGRLDFSNHIGVRLDPNDVSDTEKKGSHSSGSSSSGESEDDMRTKQTPRKLGQGIFGTQPPKHTAEDEETEDELMFGNRKATKRSTPKSGAGRSTRHSTRKVASNDIDGTVDQSDEDEDDVVITSSRRRTRSTRTASEDKAKAPRTRRPKITTVDLTIGESESSGDDAPELYSSPARKRGARAKKSYREDDFIVSDDDDEEQAEAPRSSRHQKPRRSRKARTMSLEVSEGEEQEDGSEEEPAPKRRHLKRRRPEISAQDQEDLDDDLEFLQSSPPGAKFNHNPKKVNPRQEALEALKRKRAGGDAEPSSTNGHAQVIDDSEEEEAEVALDSEENDQQIFQHQNLANGDDDLDDFLESDDEQPIGEPSNLDLDGAFYLTRISRMKSKELFRFAVEWMVQKKLNPAYSQEKEKYDITFQKLNDEVQGLVGSKFVSSAWTRDFTVSLQARPGLDLMAISNVGADGEMDKCQACNRSGHPSTWAITFHGKPYDPHTLEPIEQDDDSDEERGSDDEDIQEYDHKSRAIPPASREYNVGRFCKDNAMTAHALAHWKYQLYTWVVDYLELEGHLEDERIIKRSRWPEPKLRKYANQVIKDMEDEGQTRKLYQSFREEISTAREKKTAWRTGEYE